MLTVVDLFAGAGGLSQGFLQAGYEIKAAYEKNAYARATYTRNLQNVDMYEDVIGADYGQLLEKHGSIDVVIGGPPCQGFSKANRQHNQAISLNNKLVKEFVRAVLSMNPKAFVMENVDTLSSAIHRFFLEEADIQVVDKYRIPYKEDSISLLSENIKFNDAERIITEELLAHSLRWADNYYICLRILHRQRNNPKKLKAALCKYRRPLQTLTEYLVNQRTGIDAIDKGYSTFARSMRLYYETGDLYNEFWSSVEFNYAIQQMVQRLFEIRDNNIVVSGIDMSKGLVAKVKSCAVYDFVEKILSAGSNGYALVKQVLNAADYDVPQKRMRYIIMGVRKDIAPDNFSFPEPSCTSDHYHTVREAIEDLESVSVSYDKNAEPIILQENSVSSGMLRSKLRDSNIIYNHMTTSTGEIAMKRFEYLEEGQNFHSLTDDLKTTYADDKRTQNTIYLRLTYDAPSGTVVNVRKSMWIHPSLNRALSVREAARIQSFPDSFVFVGTKDAQYQQVGNAVPPLLAELIAKHLKKLIEHKE